MFDWSKVYVYKIVFKELGFSLKAVKGASPIFFWKDCWVCEMNMSAYFAENRKVWEKKYIFITAAIVSGLLVVGHTRDCSVKKVVEKTNSWRHCCLSQESSQGSPKKEIQETMTMKWYVWSLCQTTQYEYTVEEDWTQSPGVKVLCACGVYVEGANVVLYNSESA